MTRRYAMRKIVWEVEVMPRENGGLAPAVKAGFDSVCLGMGPTVRSAGDDALYEMQMRLPLDTSIEDIVSVERSLLGLPHLPDAQPCTRYVAIHWRMVKVEDAKA